MLEVSTEADSVSVTSLVVTNETAWDCPGGEPFAAACGVLSTTTVGFAGAAVVSSVTVNTVPINWLRVGVLVLSSTTVI